MLIVFGDSYADTGNWPKSTAISWKKPYGMTFPGEPSGRFSDGLILTDYIGIYCSLLVFQILVKSLFFFRSDAESYKRYLPEN